MKEQRESYLDLGLHICNLNYLFLQLFLISMIWDVAWNHVCARYSFTLPAPFISIHVLYLHFRFHVDSFPLVRFQLHSVYICIGLSYICSLHQLLYISLCITFPDVLCLLKTKATQLTASILLHKKWAFIININFVFQSFTRLMTQ